MVSKLGLTSAILLIVHLTLGVRLASLNIVLTTNGWVRGSRETTQRKQVDFIAFRGIPYAKPPIGELRFKVPQPADSWKPNILDASQYGNNCIGTNELTFDTYPQREDCLFLNIFVPADTKPFEKLPVMLFIHGGGFIDGSGRDYVYGPDFLIENRVILVTINYRLSAFGFLSLDLPEYSGNMGLKDQQLALKWVKRNIRRFGGDKKGITIFGQSAGGSSIQYHLLSAESQKYFDRAIMMSGTAYNPFALSPLKNHIDLAFGMADQWTANATDCMATCKRYRSNKSLPNLVEALQIMPAEVFEANMKEAPYIVGRVFQERFSPVIEGLDAVEPFLVQTPNKSYEQAIITKDVMLGINSQECLTFDVLPTFNNTDDLQQQFDLGLPFRGLSYSIGSPRYRALDAHIRQFYFGNLSIDSSTGKGPFAEIACKNIFLCSKLNVYKRESADTNLWGAAHRDDLCYLFRCTFAQSYYDDIYRTESDEQSQISLRTIDTMTKIYTNFAKYGQPLMNDEDIGELPQFESVATKYLGITNDGLKIGKNVRKRSVDFWEDIEAQAYA